MRRIISVLLENEPGALSRVVGLFSQRNYNIETLTVAPTDDGTLSRLTVTTSGSDKVIEQITKQQHESEHDHGHQQRDQCFPCHVKVQGSHSASASGARGAPLLEALGQARKFYAA